MDSPRGPRGRLRIVSVKAANLPTEDDERPWLTCKIGEDIRKTGTASVNDDMHEWRDNITFSLAAAASKVLSITCNVDGREPLGSTLVDIQELVQEGGKLRKWCTLFTEHHMYGGALEIELECISFKTSPRPDSGLIGPRPSSLTRMPLAPTHGSNSSPKATNSHAIDFATIESQQGSDTPSTTETSTSASKTTTPTTLSQSTESISSSTATVDSLSTEVQHLLVGTSSMPPPLKSSVSSPSTISAPILSRSNPSTSSSSTTDSLTTEFQHALTGSASHSAPSKAIRSVLSDSRYSLQEASEAFKHQFNVGNVGWDDLRRLQGKDAVKMMDILQTTIDEDAGRTPSYSAFKTWNLRLHRMTRLIPSSLHVAGVSKEGEHPETGGAFGEIYKGRWNDRCVALKVSHFFTTATDEQVGKIHKDFHHEAMFWKQLHHPHILPFFGLCQDLFPRRLCMVCPWMPHGNIVVYTQRHPEANCQKLLCEAASGMNYLHSLELLHGDLKGANILVNEQHQATLCDFGLVTFAELQTYGSTANGTVSGSLRWKAPEIMHCTNDDDMRKTKATDVFAFGMVVIELYTKHCPFQNLMNDGQVVLAVMAGSRPERPAEGSSQAMPDNMWEIATRCWDDDVRRRPTADRLLEELKSGLEIDDRPSFDSTGVGAPDTSWAITPDASMTFSNLPTPPLDSEAFVPPVAANGRRVTPTENFPWSMDDMPTVTLETPDTPRTLTQQALPEVTPDLSPFAAPSADEVFNNQFPFNQNPTRSRPVSQDITGREAARREQLRLDEQYALRLAQMESEMVNMDISFQPYSSPPSPVQLSSPVSISSTAPPNGYSYPSQLSPSGQGAWGDYEEPPPSYDGSSPPRQIARMPSSPSRFLSALVESDASSPAPSPNGSPSTPLTPLGGVDEARGISFGFTAPPMIRPPIPPPRAEPPIETVPLPLAPGAPFHLQAKTWTDLLELLSQHSGIQLDACPEAKRSLRSEDLVLRTVVQFNRMDGAEIDASASDWRVVIFLTLDQKPPWVTESESSTISLPHFYGLCSGSMDMGHFRNCDTSRFVSINCTSSLPFPRLPIRFDELSRYLERALKESRGTLSDNPAHDTQRLANLVGSCYGWSNRSSLESQEAQLGSVSSELVSSRRRNERLQKANSAGNKEKRKSGTIRRLLGSLNRKRSV